MSGDYVDHDITLIKHELEERRLVSEGMSQSDAHSIVSEMFNYAKESSEYYGSIKKHINK